MRTATLLVLAALPWGNLIAGESDIAKFREEYPVASRKLEETFSRMRGVYKHTKKDLREGGGVIEGRVAFTIDGGQEKAEERRRMAVDGRVEEMSFVACSNKSKGFVAFRSTSTSPYILQGVDPPEQGRKEFGSSYHRILLSPFYAISGTLSHMINDQTFELASVDRFTFDGRECLAVQYDFGAPPKSHMSLIVDPGAAWVIRHGEFRLGFADKGTVSFDIKYQGSHEGVPLPRTVSYHIPLVEDEVCEFESIEFEGTPEAEFTLGHYGLAEVSPGAGDGNQGWRVLLLVALGAAGFVVASALRRVAERMDSEARRARGEVAAPAHAPSPSVPA